MQWQMMFDGVSKEGDIGEKIKHKLEEIDKYLEKVGSDLKMGRVKLSKGARWGYKVGVNVRFPGREVRAEGRAKELLSAVDKASAKAARIVRKHFDKLQDKT